MAKGKGKKKKGNRIKGAGKRGKHGKFVGR